MEKKYSQRGKEFVFRMGATFCSYRITKEEKRVLLEGREAENGKTTFRLVLDFSSEEDKAVEHFAHTLAHTQTMPRMMAELAEEYCFQE